MKRIICVFLLLASAVVSASATNSPWQMARFDSWSIHQTNYSLADLPFDSMSHLVYGPMALDAEGNLELVDSWADDSFRLAAPSWLADVPGNLRQLRVIARRFPELAVIASFGGFSTSDFWLQVLSDPDASENARQQLLQQIQIYELSGIEIDWRYPGQQGDSFTQWQQLADFVSQLRAEMDLLAADLERPLVLGLTLPPVLSWVSDLHLTSMVPYVDYFAPISYQLHGSWESLARAPAALFSPSQMPVHQQSVDSILRSYLSRSIPASQLLMLVSPFGMGWQIPAQEPLAIFAGNSQPVRGTWEDLGQTSGKIAWQELDLRLTSADWQASYLSEFGVNQAVNWQERKIIFYDGPDAISTKVTHARQLGLLGMAMSGMHGDNNASSSLWHHMVQAQSGSPRLVGNWQLSSLWNLQLLIFVLLILVSLASYFAWYYRVRYSAQLRWQSAQQQQKRLFGEIQLLQQLVQRQYRLADELSLPSASPNLEKCLSLGLKMPQLLAYLPSIETADCFQPARQVVNPLIILQSVLQTNRRLKGSVQFEPKHLHLAAELPPIQLAEVYSIMLLLLSEQRLAPLRVVTQLQAQSIKMSWCFATTDFSHPDDLAKIHSIKVHCRKIGLRFDHSSSEFQLSIPIYHPFLDSQSILDLSQVSARQRPSGPRSDLTGFKAGQQVSQLTELEPAAVEDFWLLSATSNPEQMLKELMQQLPELADGQLSLIHSGEVLAKAGDATADAVQLVVADELTDYGLQILAKQDLAPQQLATLRVFVSQVAMVRRSLNALLKDAPLLNDLYQIGSRRDTLVYVQAERGYASLHELKSGRKNARPAIITLRLRVIKLYVDDEQLLQVHRSYLVAPQFVQQVIRVNKNRYDLVTSLGAVPVGRNFLPRLQALYPQWFAKLEEGRPLA